MSTKTEKKKKRYIRDLCCLRVVPSYGAPYRAYVAKKNKKGRIVGYNEVAWFQSRAEAERWLNQNCRQWRFCG